MEWNISAECIAAIIVFIIIMYSKFGGLLPSYKNKAFGWCLIVTFTSICTNILSTVLIGVLPQYPFLEFITYGITMIYFFVTPLMGFVYFNYIVAILYEKELEAGEKLGKYMLLANVPCIAYLVVWAMNLFSNTLFYFENSQYIRGELVSSTYVVFYLYCALSLVFIGCRNKYIESGMGKILAFFPLISFAVILVQQFFSHYVLTGSAASCALLTIYLYFQNKRLAVDALTNAFNRQEFINMLGLRIKRKETFKIAVVSMRGFKFINDKFGQKSGDVLLKDICDFLQSITKKNRIYRYGGDQFAVVLEKNEHEEIIDKIITRMKSPWNLEHSECVVSCAIGVVSFPDNAQTIDDIMNCIEYTLLQSEGFEGTMCVFCNQEILQQVKRKNEIVEILKDALAKDKFEVYFQPILNVEKNAFTVAEALLRLNDTSLGSISPGEFIPLAEQSGLIIDMTYMVLNKVCRFIRRMMEAGIYIDGISVNFSVLQFLQDDLAFKVKKIIEDNNIPYKKIKFEITESVLCTRFEKVKDFIIEMGGVGCKFGLDDFGTGFSNIASVLEVPFDTIKIDKSLVWAMEVDKRSAVFMDAIADTFHRLEIGVLAEGIETEAQSAYIREIGCDMIQGFLYARPMPEDAAMEFLKNSGRPRQ